MKTDQEYFDDYFTLCEFYLLKRGILGTIWKHVGENTCGKEYSIALRELKKFDAFLRDEVARFWKGVSEGYEQGHSFMFEEFAAKNELGGFEKRAVLFLLFSNLFHPICGWQVYELVALLDTEPSWDSKLRFHKAMNPESPLFKKNILILKPKTIGSHYDADIILNPATRSALVEFMSGKVVEIPAFNKEEVVPETFNLRDPDYSIDDVVLPQKIKEDVLFHVDSWKSGLAELGVEEKIKKGRGAIFLFMGPREQERACWPTPLPSVWGRRFCKLPCSRLQTGFLVRQKRILPICSRRQKLKMLSFVLMKRIPFFATGSGWKMSGISLL